MYPATEACMQACSAGLRDNQKAGEKAFDMIFGEGKQCCLALGECKKKDIEKCQKKMMDNLKKLAGANWEDLVK